MKRPEFYKSPLEGFLSCNYSSDSDDPVYAGFVNVFGGWIILKETRSTGVIVYAYGKSDYATAWTNKADLEYGTPEVVFADLKN